MKKLILVVAELLIVPVLSGAADLGDVYRCEFTADRPMRDAITISGNIVAADAASLGATYLTLQMAVLSGVRYDARILITSDGYNPMTIHPRGNTASTVAHTELKGDSGELVFTDTTGLTYTLKCVKR